MEENIICRGKFVEWMDIYVDDVGVLGVEEVDVGVYIFNWINIVFLVLDKWDFWCFVLFMWIEFICVVLLMILKVLLMSFLICLKFFFEVFVFFFKIFKVIKI